MDTSIDTHSINIYTDGSCYNGKGGWSYIVLDAPLGEVIRYNMASVEDTTNNRMEMVSAIEAIQSLPIGSSVLIFTDSGYLKEGFHNPSYLKKWIANKWKTSKRKPVENIDLWEIFLILEVIYNIQFAHIKGHNEKIKDDVHAKYNYIVDKLCSYKNVRQPNPITVECIIKDWESRYGHREVK
jgi:ribonuclease HI